MTLAGKAIPAFLTDGDADGCFDGSHRPPLADRTATAASIR